ncbi:MAG: HRDC domain-containing protein [Pseudomonadales bacterium]|nr:HRDC domain-containing protein [Pseudomonadales bacterium]
MLSQCQHWPVVFVDQVDQLQRALAAMQQASVLAVDTEFIRTRTFYPKLALLQVCDGESIFLIDVPTLDASAGSAVDSDGQLRAVFCYWQAWLDLLLNPSIVKVFHACEEDVELLYHYFGVYPQQVFDTQVAAGLCALDYPMAYQRLVSLLCEVELEKGDSRSDWLQRPLSDSQCRYAADDVRYLWLLHDELQTRLISRSLLAAVFSEYHLIVQGLDKGDFADAYLRIKSHHRYFGAALLRLQRLAQWREQQMRALDLPRNKIASNDAICQLAQQGERALSYLTKIDGLPAVTAKKHYPALAEILSCQFSQAQIDQAKAVPKALQIRRTSWQKRLKQRLSKEAEQSGIASSLLVKKQPIAQLSDLICQPSAVTDEKTASPIVENALAQLLTSFGWRGSYYAEAVSNIEHKASALLEE